MGGIAVQLRFLTSRRQHVVLLCSDLSEVTSRDYNVVCYTRYYPVLSHHVQYQFEPGNREQLALSTREVNTIHSLQLVVQTINFL